MPKKETSLFLLLLFFSGILFFLDQKSWLRPVRGLAEKPILVAERNIYSLNISIFQSLNIFSSKKAAKAELLRLQADMQRLSVDQNQLLTCQNENAKMKKLLGTSLPPSWKFLPAMVSGITELMRLDKGAKAGVKTGLTVVSENILVGKISQVGEYYSLVELPTTTGVKIPVVIKRPNLVGVQARGLIIGETGGFLVLDRVLQSEDIQKGDLVVTSGDEDWLPDLVVGQISDLLGKTADIYQKARVRPLADYNHLIEVFIVMR